MTDSKRLNWVDAAKGISILLVVMLYATNGAGEATGDIGLMHYIIGFATPFRMPEFFLISGLFLAHVIARPWARFADRRVVHYLYFYALWAVIHIVLKVGLASADPVTAGQYLLWAIVQPYGVLWFIYVLAMVSVAAKLLFEFRVPKWLGFAAAALLSMTQIKTGSYAIDQFAAYFVFFYSGYIFAPMIFKLVDQVIAAPITATAALVAWGLLNGTLVFSGGFLAEPTHFTMGIAEFAPIRFALALSGSVALCVLAGLLAQFKWNNWLGFIGKNSLVIYVAFVLPLGFSRLALVKLDLITDTTALSMVTMLIAIVVPLVGHWVIKRIGFGGFIFDRPNWATLPESREKTDQTIKYGAPAE